MENKNTKPSEKHQIVETWTKSIPLTYIDMTAHSSDTSLKRCGINLVL